MKQTEQIYPTKCCRCGYCCLSECCSIILDLVKGLQKYDKCPALSFNNDTASCGLLKNLYKEKQEEMGVGKGCCISGSAYANGERYEFSELPEHIKKKCVSQKRRE